MIGNRNLDPPFQPAAFQIRAIRVNPVRFKSRHRSAWSHTDFQPFYFG
jgi:hypothetical protein